MCEHPQVLQIVFAHLRHKPARALAMVLSIVFATSGFTVLTASTSRSELAVVGQVGAHSRGAYDVLIRPKGSRSTLEQSRGLLRPNFLASQYGGITSAQWRRIATIPGVDLAAPVASLGYVPFFGLYRADLTAAVDTTATRQLIRQRQIWRADRNLTTAADAASLVYVTTRPLIRPKDVDPVGGKKPYDDGIRRTNPCGAALPWPTWEVQEDGRALPLCLTDQSRSGRGRAPALVVRRLLDGRFEYPSTFAGLETSLRLSPAVLVAMSFSVQAVDPASEARLDGLDQAVVSGRHLARDVPGGDTSLLTRPDVLIPALATTKPAVDERVSVRAQRLRLPASGVAGLGPAQAGAVVTSAAVATTRETPAVTAYQIQQAARGNATLYGSGNFLQEIGRPGPVNYDVAADKTLHPRAAPPASTVWTDPSRAVPRLWTDRAVRRTQTIGASSAQLSALRFASIDPVGYFDPGRLTKFDPLARTPLDTFEVDQITGADAASRSRLGGQTLAPSSNPGGYTTPPPTFLISLNWLTALTKDPAPISAVRVRVGGVTGFDPLSRERVRLTAQRIAEATGLDVEITLGASPSAQTVVLPPGAYGRPELRLSEEWTRKGVAAVIVSAVERKSVVLFVLILVVCVLFVANAVSAAVQERAAEFGVLSCVGWPRRRVAALMAGELLALGLLAGILSVLLALPVGRMIGAPVSLRAALWALPVAVGVAVVAGLPPAWRGTRDGPLAILRGTPPENRLHRLPVPLSVLGVSIANLVRKPGRTGLGAGAIGVGVAALTVLAAITWAFHGTVVGSLLGDAVSLQVRGVDLVAVGAIMLLSLLAVADVQYLNVRERAAELAVLRTAGWSNGALGRLIAYEGGMAGLLGSTLGALVGLGAAGWLAGSVPGELVLVAVAAATVGTVLAVSAATIPALLVTRLSLVGQLADE